MEAMQYEVNKRDAEDLMLKVDELQARGASSAYADGVKDALGWVLGYYDEPEVAK